MNVGRTHLSLCRLGVFLALAACSPDNPAPEFMAPEFSQARSGPSPVDPTASWLLPISDAGLAFQSDGLYSDGTYSVYQDGVCNVSATIFATTQKSNSGDAVIQSSPASKGKACNRTFTLRYPDGFQETVNSFNNLRNLQNTEYVIPVGSTARRVLILNPGAIQASSRCGRLLFGVGDNPLNGAGSDSVLVTRLSARSWRVQSDGESNLAWCQNTGELFAMPVDFRVVASYDLPL